MTAPLNPDDVEIAARAIVEDRLVRWGYDEMLHDGLRRDWLADRNTRQDVAAALTALAAAGRVREPPAENRDGTEPFGIDYPTTPGYWIKVHPSGWPHERIDVEPGWRVQWVPVLGGGPVPPHKPQVEPKGIAISTMCVCGDNQQLASSGSNLFVPHINRRTGNECSGMLR